METTAETKQQTTPVRIANTIPVTVENFIRAETDFYFNSFVKKGGLGKFDHNREATPIDEQSVIRMNRDTFYSAAVFDLEAGPVTITLPDAGSRFMSMQVINQDHYTITVVYEPGNYTFTKEEIGTRYLVTPIRTLANPNDPNDIKEVHRLQDAIKVEQKNGPGKFEIPQWDITSQKKVRDALLLLAASTDSFKHSFGKKTDVDPIKHLIGTAAGWGGNPDKEAVYLGVNPSKNDGKTIYGLTIKEVPVDAFWSISVYNEKGFFEKNSFDAYSINNLTAKANTDGSFTIQFGGCDGKIPNCLPITPGWNYTVRLYRPRKEILEGKWKFPEAQPVS